MKTPHLVALAAIVPTLFSAAAALGADPQSVDPAKLPRVASVDARFLSYNVEMAELTGGLFWKPYDEIALMKSQGGAGASAPPGSAEFYDQAKRPLKPVDLSNERLRKLAAAIGPAYVRASGNAADAVYFHDADTPAPDKAPEGFEAVLTRGEWKGLIDFAKAVDAKIVTSFAISTGVRDAQGLWTPREAKKLIEYTKSVGGEIAAADFANEPTLAPQGIGDAPKGYDAQAFARDFAIFRPFARKAAPDMLILGPSSTGEGPVRLLAGPFMSTESIFQAKPKPQFDAFTYHSYPASSLRCKAPGKLNTTIDQALSEEWLERSDVTYNYYSGLRDRYQPGKAMWLTETAQSSCGGDPWSSTFLDTFRFLDLLGRLAKHGVHTVMHNTLAQGDYSLIDGETMKPRPNYWAALLWRRLMGTTVLDADVPRLQGLHLYAQCRPGAPGAVTLLAINNSRNETTSLVLPVAAQRYTLSAGHLEDHEVQLNGRPLELQPDGELPQLRAQAARAGKVDLAPLTITFLTVAANNGACGT
jgi:heparanase 1